MKFCLKVVLSWLIFSSSSGFAAQPQFKRVFIVVLENTNYPQALKQPFLRELSSKGATLANYSAIFHPSYPNYLAMVSGSTHGKFNDKLSVFNSKHIGDLLEAKGMNWKNYAEGYAGDCGLRNYNKFVARHVPFLSFANVRTPERCSQHIVDARQLDVDIVNGTLPEYSFYSPDKNNDGHDTGVAYADTWLEEAFRPRLNDPKFMEGLLFVVTFDEDEGGSLNNHVLTILVGDSVKPGYVSSAKLNHYSLLKTVEMAFGLGTLGHKDQTIKPIPGVWK